MSNAPERSLEKIMPLLSMKRPPPHKLFFAKLEVRLNPTDLERIGFAYNVSKYGHAKQLRDDGTRYFDHPKAVACIAIEEFECLDPHVIILALLHDTDEDSYLMSMYRLGHNFGEEMALDVCGITKLPKGKETTEEYLGRVIDRGARVIFVKLCDRLHNLRELGNCKPEKIARQLAETKAYHIPLLLTALRRFGGQWVEYAERTEQKMLEIIALYE